jgi:23S rRNA pseudouridine1911/1915/1917 synthase
MTRQASLPPIIYEDADYVVLDKPSGMLVIPGRFDNGAVSLQELLKQKYGAIFTVHRLDKDTSGVICFAKNAEAHKHLNLQFDNHEVRKTYLAFTCGVFKRHEDAISIPLSPNPKKKGTMVADRRGKKSITYYKVLEQFNEFAFVQVMPRTGRTHQIRAHFAAIGHPLAIDPLYKKWALANAPYAGRKQRIQIDPHTPVTKELFVTDIQKGYEGPKGEPLIARLTLHSWKLVFKHHLTGAEVEVIAPKHSDFDLFLEELRKHGR